MFLRSHAKKIKEDINFDEASEAWMRNKKRVGQSYIYICGSSTKSNRKCINKVKSSNTFCHCHKNIHKNKKL